MSDMETENHKAELIEYFNGHSRNGIFDAYSPDDEQKINALLDDVHFPMGEPVSVLDCGCGTGRSTRLFARRLGDGCRVVGMDIAPGMIEKAREIVNDNADINVEFTVGDCHNVPFDDSTFDWVVVIESYPHFGDTPKVLDEFFRILKEGGFLAILNRQSSTDINAFHRSLGGPVSEDVMPDMMSMLLYLKRTDFWVMVYVDDDDGFRLLVRK